MIDHNQAVITVTRGISGYFAVCMVWNSEGFYEPSSCGFGRYKELERHQAVEEAQRWAEEEGLPYEDPGETFWECSKG